MTGKTETVGVAGMGCVRGLLSNWKRLLKAAALALGILVGTTTLFVVLASEWQIAKMIVLWVCVAGMFSLFTGLIYSILGDRERRRNRDE